MVTKTLSTASLAVIDHYLHFNLGSAVCSVPYFNNKTKGARGLRAYTGKGSPKEIFDEVETIVLKHRIDQNTLSDEALKKILTDNNIGIDCSGFTFHVLKTEFVARAKGGLGSKLYFVNRRGILGQLRARLNAAGNADVLTFASDRNSNIVTLDKVEPGDIITVQGGADGPAHNHILIIHQVEYENSLPIRINYSHSIAYPEDGIYSTGVRQGQIEIVDPMKSLIEQKWSENNIQGAESLISRRLHKAEVVELRRLK